MTEIAEHIMTDVRKRTDAMQDVLDDDWPYTRDVASMFFHSPNVIDQKAEFEHDEKMVYYTFYFKVLVRKRTKEYADTLMDRRKAEDLIHKAGLWLQTGRFFAIRSAVKHQEYATHVEAAEALIKRVEETKITSITV